TRHSIAHRPPPRRARLEYLLTHLEEPETGCDKVLAGMVSRPSGEQCFYFAGSLLSDHHVGRRPGHSTEKRRRRGRAGAYIVGEDADRHRARRSRLAAPRPLPPHHRTKQEEE